MLLFFSNTLKAEDDTSLKALEAEFASKQKDLELLRTSVEEARTQSKKLMAEQDALANDVQKKSDYYKKLQLEMRKPGVTKKTHPQLYLSYDRAFSSWKMAGNKYSTAIRKSTDGIENLSKVQLKLSFEEKNLEILGLKLDNKKMVENHHKHITKYSEMLSMCMDKLPASNQSERSQIKEFQKLSDEIQDSVKPGVNQQ
jgi:hypothetical protein